MLELQDDCLDVGDGRIRLWLLLMFRRQLLLVMQFLVEVRVRVLRAFLLLLSEKCLLRTIWLLLSERCVRGVRRSERCVRGVRSVRGVARSRVV